MNTARSASAFLRTYSGLSRAVYILFIARIINRMGDFVHLFLTLYLTGIAGMEVASVGTVLMISALSGMAGAVAGGKLSDHIGRKAVMVGAQFASAGVIGVCGFLPPGTAVPVLLIISYFFKGAVRPASRSMLTDITAGNERQKAFSLLYLGTNLGVAIGPMIAGFLFKNYLAWIFWGDALSSLLAFSLILKFVPESVPSEDEIEKSGDNALEKADKSSAVAAFFSRPVLVFFSLFTVMTNFMYSQSSFSLPLQMNSIFSSDGAMYLGYLMSFNAVIVLVFTGLVMELTKKFKPVNNMAVSTVFLAAGFGMLSGISSFPGFLFSTFFWTIGEILMVTNGSVYIANHTPINLRGRFGSITSIVFGSGNIAGPYISGHILSSGSLSGLWRIIFFTGIITSVFFILLGRYEKIKNRGRK